MSQWSSAYSWSVPSLEPRPGFSVSGREIVRRIVISLLPACLLCCVRCTSDQNQARTPYTAIEEVSGSQVFASDFMGQEAPGLEPVVFAPGIVSTDRADVAFEMSPDGREIYFVRFFSDIPRIMFTRHTADGWSTPAVAPFAGDSYSFHPSFHPDGTTLFFSTRRPLPADWPGERPAPDSREAIKVWQVVRDGVGWSAPRPVFIPGGLWIADAAVAANGTIYASGILKATLENGRYAEPEELTPRLEGHWPYIAPDESYIIYGHGFPRQLLVSFQLEDGTWTAPQSCSDDFGFEGAEMNGMPYVTPDGRYLFFTANHDIYWVDAQVIRRLAPNE